MDNEKLCLEKTKLKEDCLLKVLLVEPNSNLCCLNLLLENVDLLLLISNIVDENDFETIWLETFDDEFILGIFNEKELRPLLISIDVEVGTDSKTENKDEEEVFNLLFELDNRRRKGKSLEECLFVKDVVDK